MSNNLVQLRFKKTGLSLTDNALQRLRAIVHEKREITESDIRTIAKETRQPEAAVYGVATYYSDLGLGKKGKIQIKVCRGTACFAASGESHVQFVEEAFGLKLGETSADGSVSLESVYCLGLCHCGPAIEVNGVAVGGIDQRRATDVSQRVKTNESLPVAWLPKPPPIRAVNGPAIVLERLERPIDATGLDVALKHGAFEGLKKALNQMTPSDVLREVEVSALRGRGGAGFSTATKWRFAAQNLAAQSSANDGYIVCNADEGDPGSYIDKHILERDPFAVIEGLTLAGYAIGAKKGVIYIRSEYPDAVAAQHRALVMAKSDRLLGRGILGTAFDFDIEVVTGAGSYVCGEETALLRSLEGLRGMVTARPPFPAERGLFGRPTVVNNVETLVNIGWIIRHGGSAYSSIGFDKSRGTKTVCLNERFVAPGIYEVPLGTPVDFILNELGGGMKTKRPIKAVQIGGPLGGILPHRLLSTPLGFESLDAVGALLGHGGIVAWDDSVNARDIAEHLFEFCDAESCGKCVPCRLGGRRGLELIRRMKRQQSADFMRRDVETLTALCETMKYGSLCAHGGGIPAPIASLLLHFQDEMTALVDSTRNRGLS